jgi:TetR/AcrR family transcriptional regulator
MKPAFKKLKPAKQNIILLSAIEEFFNYGFKDASTNRIVEKADISKGSLYYYFGNKSDLYNSCQSYTFDIFIDYVKNYTQTYEGFIERLIRVNSFKQQFQSQHPEVLNFFINQYFKGLFPEEILKKLKQLDYEFKLRLAEDLNYDLFRDDINVDHAMQLISWTIQGYERDIEQQAISNSFNFDNLEQCFEDSQVYFETLKKVYYK